MGHPNILNETPFVLELFPCTDEQGGGLVVTIVKATYRLTGRGDTALASEQQPVRTAPEHWGDPEHTAYKLDADTTFHKPATDVVLIGHAYPPQPRASRSEVDFQLGSLRKQLRVTGDRVWRKTIGGGVSASSPLPFDKIPLSYDRAYGGWDRSSRDPREHRCDMRNPRGVGYRAPKADLVDGSPLPNIEDPQKPLESYHGESTPAGVGFTEPHYEPRRALFGTYDEAWMRDRSPLLPRDFNRASLNAASPGLIAAGYLRGDEALRARGVRPGGAELLARLPGVVPPVASVRVRSAVGAREVKTQLDTVIIDADTEQLVLIWRGHTPAPEGLQGVAHVHLTCANAQRPFVPRSAPLYDNVITLPRRSPSA